jgi:hypothetical protein
MPAGLVEPGYILCSPGRSPAAGRTIYPGAVLSSRAYCRIPGVPSSDRIAGPARVNYSPQYMFSQGSSRAGRAQSTARPILYGMYAGLRSGPAPVLQIVHGAPLFSGTRPAEGRLATKCTHG